MKRAQSNRQGNHARPLHKSVSPALVLSLVTIISIAAAPRRSLAGPAGYSFQAIAYLGDDAPGGGKFVSDFEPTRLNNRGQVAFTAEPDVPGKEAVFLAGGGTIEQIMRFGQPAPGGGTFSTFELGPIGLNDSGDLALPFMLEPLQFDPFINGGVYRYSHITPDLTAGLDPRPTAPG